MTIFGIILNRRPLPRSYPLPPGPITGDLTARYAEAWMRERRRSGGLFYFACLFLFGMAVELGLILYLVSHCPR